MITGDAHRVPLRQVLRGKLNGVHHQFDTRLRRIDELVLRVELFENVVLQRAADRLPIDTALLGHCQVHGPDDRGRTVDGLTHSDLTDRNVRVQTMHIFDRADRNTASANFACGQRIIRIAPHQRGQIERRGQTSVRLRALGILKQVLEATVGVVRRTEPSKLPHGPKTIAVHRLVNAAREREDARLADARVRLGSVRRIRGVHRGGAVALIDHVARERHRLWVDGGLRRRGGRGGNGSLRGTIGRVGRHSRIVGASTNLPHRKLP